MKGKRLYSAMITIACLASAFTINAYQIDCPKEMTIKVKVEEMPDGWEISEDRTYTSSFFNLRSEERRVGKECRTGWSPERDITHRI